MIRTGHGMSEYVCPLCGSKQLRAGRFVLVPENERAYKGQEIRLPEFCMAMPPLDEWGSAEHGSALCRGVMVWTPTASAHDLLGENFVVDLDGKQTKISSLHELREFENLSLRKTRNGEGSPSIFRGFSQDRSNRDVNVFRGSEYEKNRQIPIDRRTHAGPITASAIEQAKAERRRR